MKSLLSFLSLLVISSICLAQNSNFLYGVTQEGGNNGAGTIFHFDPASGTQIVDYSFMVEIEGANPNGDLSDGGNGKFYGLAGKGGGFNRGIIFEWDPATNVYAKKIDFDGYNKGSSPKGSLTLFNGKFYGMTSNGGIYGDGVIFEWDPATNVFTKKIDLEKDTKGSRPWGSLTLKDGLFYGMTYYGGSFGDGLIFEWNPATNVFISKISFKAVERGSHPYGSLSLKDGKFYGMTSDGGIFSGNGVIFEWDPTTNIFTKKIDFDGTGKGSNPYGSLILRDGRFYGITSNGGNGDHGVIFEWNPATNVFSKNIDFFYAPLGSLPEGYLVLNNDKFYGITKSGGAIGKGVIFEWNPSTGVYSKKFSFDISSLGSVPFGALSFKDGKFYGTTKKGGSNDDGVIFEWDPSSNLYTKKFDFDDTVTGRSPNGPLVLSKGKFYGTTEYGGAHYDGGVIFEWDPLNNAYSKRIDFDQSDPYQGCNPVGALALEAGKFYGMTVTGASYPSLFGVIFEWDPTTNIYINKIYFSEIDNGGRFPYGSFTQHSEMFYGMTQKGGINNRGVIFKWDPVNNNYMNIIDFNGIENGENPLGSLTLNDGKLFGMTYQGGVTGDGVIFKFDPSSNIYSKLYDFSGPDGSSPAFTQFTLYNSNTGVDEYNSSIHISPNPTSGILEINSPVIIDKIVLYNSLGVVIKSIESKLTKYTINLSDQPKGVYTIELNINNRITTRKLVIV